MYKEALQLKAEQDAANGMAAENVWEDKWDANEEWHGESLDDPGWTEGEDGCEVQGGVESGASSWGPRVIPARFDVDLPEFLKRPAKRPYGVNPPPEPVEPLPELRIGLPEPPSVVMPKMIPLAQCTFHLHVKAAPEKKPPAFPPPKHLLEHLKSSESSGASTDTLAPVLAQCPWHKRKP